MVCLLTPVFNNNSNHRLDMTEQETSCIMQSSPTDSVLLPSTLTPSASIPIYSVPRPEYPRPQFVRKDWECLNGAWEFAFDDADAGLTERWFEGHKLERVITVPFAYQTPLSGIDDKGIHEIVWYARDFTVPETEGWRGKSALEFTVPDKNVWQGKSILLHFGAVDYRTTVWINGIEVGHNRGGHVPFTFDITPYLKPDSAAVNRICLRVEDKQDATQPRGKQSKSGLPQGIDYYCTTGIWQTVWMEPVPHLHIRSLSITPILSVGVVVVDVFLHAPAGRWRLTGELLDGDEVVAEDTIDTLNASAQISFEVPEPKAWTPDSPHLYDMKIRFMRSRVGEDKDASDTFDLENAEESPDENVIDEVESYTGLVDVALKDGKFLLNEKPTYLAMVLDQGYWLDGGMTAPTDAALRADVEWCKRFGFNGARKHQKVEDPRWLHWCDRLGLMVWGEMANARAWSAGTEEAFVAEWERAVRRDQSSPALVAWVPVNESMGLPGLKEGHPGQYAFLERIVALTRLIDPARPIIDNDGWEHTDVTDIIAIHDYSHTSTALKAHYKDKLAGGEMPPRIWTGSRAVYARGAAYQGQPIMLTEVGGFLALPDLPAEQRDNLYKVYAAVRDNAELLVRYEDLMEGLAQLPFVSGFCYTQLTDIEQEINGLLTYDRKAKVEPERIAEIHRRLFGTGVHGK